ncbi:MAG: DUF4126 family protein [Pseudomonadales bacterium]
MDEYQTMIGMVALTMGVGWASGINLYAALLMLGIGGATGNIDLPEQMLVLTDPMVMMAAGVMFFAEFIADKTPGVDTGWDAIHTFIRIPAGALLAASAVGDVTPAWEISAGIMGGGLALTSHATKAGTRALVNTSPEPFTNWALSFGEDIAVIGGLWVALTYPELFLALLAVFLIFAIWFLPKIWRALRTMARKIGQWLGMVDKTSPESDNIQQTSSRADQLYTLKELFDSGALSDEEFEAEKRTILGT